MDLNYRSTFIAIAEDCPGNGEVPPARDKKSSAEVQYQMLVGHPYEFTQEEVLFESSTLVREAGEIPPDQKALWREEFFSRSQACLRASALPKRYGWGIHFDAEGRAAAYPAGSDEYRRFAQDPSLTQTRGMRSKRA